MYWTYYKNVSKKDNKQGLEDRNGKKIKKIHQEDHGKTR